VNATYSGDLLTSLGVDFAISSGGDDWQGHAAASEGFATCSEYLDEEDGWRYSVSIDATAEYDAHQTSGGGTDHGFAAVRLSIICFGTKTFAGLEGCASVTSRLTLLGASLPRTAEGEDGVAATSDGVTIENPVATSIVNPAGGYVAITESALQPDPTDSLVFLGREVFIDAELEATPEDPIVLTFTVHSSLLFDADGNSLDPDSITVVRDGEPATDCATNIGVADPDPCVLTMSFDGDGNLILVVLTSHASSWAVVAPDSASTARADREQMISALDALRSGDKSLDRRIDRAIGALEDGLKPTWWTDQDTLAAKGNKVFDADKQVVKELTKEPLASNPYAANVVQSVLESDRSQAATAIANALARGVKANDVSAAQSLLDKADVLGASLKFEQAVDAYGAAWQRALKAK
jgi:hypothetical protein